MGGTVVKNRKFKVNLSWVTGTLGCKSGTKNSRNTVQVLLERYE